MRYWLLKSEPDTFSIQDLAKAPQQTECWEGVRNYQARNFIRDDMNPQDLAFFYHSNCKEPGIVGTMRITSKAYPDDTAFNSKSEYFDPKSTIDNPRWYMVDVKLMHIFANTITLKQLKQERDLSEMIILRRGNRLSITPITPNEWQYILDLSTKK